MKYILPLILILGIAASFSSCTKDNTDLDDLTENVSNSTQEHASLQNITETESLSVEVEDYINVEDNKVEAPAYNLDIPEDFVVKASDDNLLLENKKGTIQFNIMDKTSVTTDFIEYAEDTYNAAETGGMAQGELEDVAINNVAMKRFPIEVKQEKAKLISYVYFAQVNGRILMITLTSKDGGLEDVAAADEFVAQIDF